jgi:hypothetical protein
MQSRNVGHRRTNLDRTNIAGLADVADIAMTNPLTIKKKSTPR